MRQYNCYYTDDINNIYNMESHVCFASINHINYFGNSNCQNEDNIYIDKFRYNETKEYIKTLVEIINNITPCELITIDNIELIKFKLLKNYDSSLVLLSFIRTLWYNPLPVQYLEESNIEDKLIYVKSFFNLLGELKNEIKDSMELLLTAHKKALEPIKIPLSYSDIHSNVYASEQLAIKSTKDLLNYNGSSTEGFLCDK